MTRPHRTHARVQRPVYERYARDETHIKDAEWIKFMYEPEREKKTSVHSDNGTTTWMGRVHVCIKPPFILSILDEIIDLSNLQVKYSMWITKGESCVCGMRVACVCVYWRSAGWRR